MNDTNHKKDHLKRSEEETRKVAEHAEDEGGKKEEQELGVKVKSLQEELEQTTNALRKSLADYQNYKRRNEEEQKSMTLIASGILLGKVLDVIDDFELTVKNIPEDVHESQWFTGLQMVLGKLKNIITSEGLERIDLKEGDLYNPAIQEVIGTVEGEEDNRIVQVLSVGYKLQNRVIRPAKVIVSRKGLK